MIDCNELGIPPHLHRKGREYDNQFNADEKMFRRYPAYPVETSKSIIVKENFNFDSMSFNREKYSENPSDVLFSIKDKNHFFRSHKIVSLKVQEIEGLKEIHPDDQEIYSFKVIHDPEDCMYPHCIVQVLKNGKNVPGIKPSSVKSKIREKIEKMVDFIE